MRPTHVNILGVEFDIEYVKHIIVTDGEPRVGETDVHEATIHIFRKQSEDCIRDTLLHEILHAIWWALKLGDKADEEQVASTMSRALITVMRQNPTVSTYIF